MNKKSLAEKVVDEMFDKDLFSQWLGIERVLIEEGHCILKMKVRKEMINGFGIAHGGIAFSFADSALAFASNAYGRLSVALECSISFPVAVKEGDELICEAKELSLTNKTGTYLIEIKNQKKENVAFFKGTVYRTSKEWFPNGTDNESVRIYESETKVISEKSKDEKLIYPDLSYKIIGCAYEVYNELGGGQKENIYQKALAAIFKLKNINYKEQVYYPVNFKTFVVGKNYLDFFVEDKIIVEIKSAGKFSKQHYDQVLNYLNISNIKLALLIMFTGTEVRAKRVINFKTV